MLLLKKPVFSLGMQMIPSDIPLSPLSSNRIALFLRHIHFLPLFRIPPPSKNALFSSAFPKSWAPQAPHLSSILQRKQIRLKIPKLNLFPHFSILVQILPTSKPSNDREPPQNVNPGIGLYSSSRFDLRRPFGRGFGQLCNSTCVS